MHNCRLVLPLETAEDKRATAEQLAYQRLLRMNPAKLGGMQLCLQDLAQATMQAMAPWGKVSQGCQDHIMQHHGAMDRLLEPEERLVYEQNNQLQPPRPILCRITTYSWKRR